MFRPTGILQAAIILLTLGGCASTSGGTDTHPPQMDQSSSGTALPEGAAITPSARPFAPGDFLGPDGGLVPQLEQFAQATAQAQGIPAAEIEALLRTARYNAQAVRLMTPPANRGRIRRAWASYRQRHVDPIRIRRGADFWQAHRDELDRTSRRTGVPASIIVAILGIETVYGGFTGDHRVLDTLTTLAFRFPDPTRPDRQAMFRDQLADLIVLNHQGRLDAYTVQGSFAGAVGLPQFMPGSILRYAVDGNGDGRIDLAGSTADAIASVGAFLQAHGWVRDLPVFASVRWPADPARLVQDGLEPLSSWAALQAAGVQPLPGSGTAWQAQPLGVIDLQDEARGTHDYRCATPNFFAITQYNRSYFYAAAVADLAQEIARRADSTAPGRISQTRR